MGEFIDSQLMKELIKQGYSLAIEPCPDEDDMFSVTLSMTKDGQGYRWSFKAPISMIGLSSIEDGIIDAREELEGWIEEET